MKIVVVGGTGLIGARTTALLRSRGHEVIAAARSTGVDSYTGEGLDDSLAGAHVIVDTSNSSYVDEAAAREFFYASTLNLLTFGAAHGVRHHATLSVVNTERLARAQGGYFQAKADQERLITTSARPYTLVHATQFFEFVRSITDSATQGGVARLPDALIRPMAADDVAAAVAAAAEAEPRRGIVEHAGPEVFELRDLAVREMRSRRDDREVIADPLGTYFGARLSRHDLLPSPGAHLAATRFGDWQQRGRLVSSR
ncbi:SDR family oxidoreductase [Microbacterium lushaniae]|uniref:NmrA family transcriptional regulator n=1 Tax=Microbacterium lushaniae TaxID=2614639 RepID=A0A5J6L4Y8_9MICO|nr:NAD-dependent epimerase/dehydratase family protein [Microbacterium lushaniae]QEW03480.1 NmrA family transcriptional regulator [Microbacterium lushaniae]